MRRYDAWRLKMKTMVVPIKLEKFGKDAWPDGVPNELSVKVPWPDDDSKASAFHSAFESFKGWEKNGFVAQFTLRDAIFEGCKVIARKFGNAKLLSAARESKGSTGTRGKTSNVTIA